MAPTRELAVQIGEESRKFGKFVGIRSTRLYEGAPKYPQIQALSQGGECSKGMGRASLGRLLPVASPSFNSNPPPSSPPSPVEVAICTPGRCNDLIEMRKCDLSSVKFVVLDEADRMLDMGFEPQIRSILAKVTCEHQTLLFSATWPKEIQQLAMDFSNKPVQINVGEVNMLVANKDIKQEIMMVQEAEKPDELAKILGDIVKESPSKETHKKTIVFTAKKISCDHLANQLWDQGFAVDCLHGDREQWQRTKIMNAFKRGELRLMIATDVAARGLDVKDIEVVINYDMPAGVSGVEDYVHRIGRTGRAGAKGTAHTFFTRGDAKNATKLVEVLKKAEQDIPAELQAMVRPPRGGGGRGFGGRGGGRGRGGYSGGRGCRGGGDLGGGGGGGGRGGGRGKW
jgi:ATP-dependent RNA helicase DDX5/DBP2